VSHVAQKVFDLDSWNFTGMFISMLCTWHSACGFIQSYCPWLSNFFSNFQIMSHVVQKVFDLESWNFTGMFISIWSCAPGYFRVDLFSICRVIARELVNIISLCCVLFLELESTNFTGIMVNITVKRCTWDFSYGVFSVLLELLPLT
jgi:hypothetical protein